MTQWGLDVLFNPSKRHMDEEKQRLQSTREEVGDASGGKRIDFESGKVVIRRPKTAKDDAEQAAEQSTEQSTGQSTGQDATEDKAAADDAVEVQKHAAAAENTSADTVEEK